MSEEIIKVLDNLAQKFGTTIDWTSQNIMPYLQDLMSRFIQYKNSISILWIVIATILIIISIICIVKLIKWIKKDEYCDDELAAIGFIVTTIVMIIAICILINNITGLIKNTYIPEMIILNEVKTLI